MGRFHRHPDGTEHIHDHEHENGHDTGDHSGYTATGTSRVSVLEDIFSENDRVAEENRRVFAAAGVRHAGARIRLIVNDPGDRLGPMLTSAGLSGTDVDVTSVPYDQVPAAMSDVTATFAFIQPAPSKVASAATKVSESWAMGLPVAVNDGVGDAADLVRDDGLGIVVDPAATASFPERAQELVALGADDATRRRCRATAEQRFDIATAARTYDRVYSEVTVRPGQRR